LNVNLQCR